MELVDEIDRLASMPDVAVRIDEMLEDENSSAWDIGRIIERDPSLTAAMLKLANSALYNTGGVPITAIDRAVTIVGARRVRDLAFGVFAVSAFTGIPDDLVTMSAFWTHSLSTAATAHAVATHVGHRHRDALFIAGLLHDIGKLVMYGLRPAPSREVLQRLVDAGGDDTPVDETDIERSVFGYDHAMVGGALARRWLLPDALCEAIGRHHDVADYGGIENVARVTALANALAHLPADAEADYADIDDAMLDGTGVSRDAIGAIRSQATATFEELQGVFVNGG